MEFPVFSQLSRELAPETDSLVTASSSEESGANRTLRGCIPRPLDAFAEFFNSADLRADYIEGLRKAGVPEE
jgi:hypothetical protein